VDHPDAGDLLEQLGRHVVGCAAARRRIVEAVGMFVRVGHELAHVLHRQGIVDHDDDGLVGDAHDGGQVAGHVEGDAAQHERGDGQRVRGKQQRMAVRRGLGHEVGADVAAGPRLVVDDDGLAEDVRQRLRDVARQHVVAPARRERHDEAHLPGGIRIALRPGTARHSPCHRGQRGQEGTPVVIHSCLLSDGTIVF